MKTDNLDISYEDTVIQVENWPQADHNESVQDNTASDPDNLAILPVCKDGVCQLGAWKPRKLA